MLRATAACNFSTSELQTVRFLTFWKCASQFFSSTCELHPFFNILTCKCASRHSGVPVSNIGTSKNGPRMRCFVHFDHFSTSALQKVVGEWCVVQCILIWKNASSHNDARSLIFALSTCLCTRRFSEPTFRPEETKRFATFLTFHTCIFCLMTPVSPGFAFPLCYSTFHIVGS